MQKDERQPDDEIIIELPLNRLRGFKNHPFKVEMDDEMKDLKESISKYGILNPLIVRPVPDGVYEIISGHRRRYVAELLHYNQIPVIIRVMTDDEAVINMVDSNVQRTQIKPSERAFSLKMKYEAIKRKGGRKKNGQNDDPYAGRKSVEIVGKSSGISPKNVQRYMKLTELVPELLERLDQSRLSVNPGVAIADLTHEEQKQLLEAMDSTQSIPSLSQAQRLKRMSEEGTLTYQKMEEILSESKMGNAEQIIFKCAELYKFFPPSYSTPRIRREILGMMEAWKEKYC